MPFSVSNHGTESVCKEIYRIEENPQHGTPGPAINNLPAQRSSQGGTHMEGGKGKKE